MSKATKKKLVTRQWMLREFELPTPEQKVLRIKESCGNNLHSVEDADGESYLVSMPTKFRKSVWAKRGDFFLVEPIKEGNKVFGEVVDVVSADYRRFLQDNGAWLFPSEDIKGVTQEGVFENTNRRQISHSDSSDSDTD